MPSKRRPISPVQQLMIDNIDMSEMRDSKGCLSNACADNASLTTAPTVDTSQSLQTETISGYSSSDHASELTMEALTQDPFERVAVYQRSGANNVREVLNTMTNNPFNIEIQCSSCEVIARMSYDEFYRVVIGSSGGVLIVTATMRNYPNNADIQACGCIILGNLCTESLDNKAQVCAANGIDIIAAAMRCHKEVPLVQSSAYFALKQITALNGHGCEQTTRNNVQLAHHCFQATLSDDETSDNSNPPERP